MKTPGIHNMLDLSTRHVNAAPRHHRGVVEDAAVGWGKLRVAEHTEGWTVFVPGDMDEEEIAETEPEWIRPVMAYARVYDCMVVNFDKDGEVIPFLPQWNW